MNEVEKMYENAEPDRNCNLYKHFTECPMKHTQCEDCENFVYPPSTPEKQLEILQFCLKWGQVHILQGIDKEYRIENCCYRQGYQPTIADAIANYINEKWEKLTPEERKQIKEILQ